MKIEEHDTSIVYVCKNCETEFQGKFCNNCGQKSNIERLSFKSILDQFVYGLTKLDRGLLYTIYKLFKRPGQMIKNYLAGCRVVFSKPLPLLIILCGIYGILMSVMNFSLGESPTYALENESEQIEELFTDKKLFEGVKIMINYIKGSTFFWAIIMLPFYALCTKWIFRKQNTLKYNYTELFFVNIFLACQRVIIDIVAIPYIWIVKKDTPSIFDNAIILIYLFLAVWCFKDLFSISWGKSIKKTILMFISSFTIAIILLVLLVFLIIAIFLPEVFSKI